MVGGFVDGDEEVSRILPLFAGFGLRLLLPRRALLRASLLAEALDGGQDGARASLGASRASDGEPRVSGADEMPRAVCADPPRAGSTPGDGGERLGVDEVDERANAGAVVQPELVLQGAVANVLGHVQAEAALGRLVDAEHVAVRRTLGGIRPAPSGGSVEGELDLIVGALLLTELVGAVDGKSRWIWMERQDICANGSLRPIRDGRDARGRGGDRDSGELGSTAKHRIARFPRG